MATDSRTLRKPLTVEVCSRRTASVIVDSSEPVFNDRTCVHQHYIMNVHRALVLVFLVLSTQLAMAHEYWLAPVQSLWQTGEIFQADIRNGENFTGPAYPFDTDTIRVGGLVSNTARRALAGRLGDYPAIRFELQEPGMQMILLETTARELEYDTRADFHRFLDYHSLDTVVAGDQSADSDDSAIKELYYRFVKTLFYVDESDRSEQPYSLLSILEKDPDAPALQAQGQHFELVINGSSTGILNILLMFDEHPLPGRQIEIFFKSATNKTITRSTTWTNEMGHASVVATAPGNYLVNSVWITPEEKTDIDWKTYWASLTFSIAENTQ